jgi:hypothetical protein
MSTATISEKKRAANRANARKSTGPRTPEGKARASLNAISHGLFCKDLVLPGESRETFDLLRRLWISSLNPQDTAELWLVDRIVAANWKLRRLQESESLFHHADKNDVLQLEDLEEKLQEMHQRDPHSERPLTPDDLRQVPSAAILCVQLNAEDKARRFERMSKYEQRLEQSVHRAMRQLRQLRKDREKEEELPRSPFLDDELEIEEEEEKKDMGEPPMPQSQSTEDQNDENEPTADREDASGKAGATSDRDANKNKITQPCAGRSSAPPSLRAGPACAGMGSQFGRDPGRSSISQDTPTPSRGPAIRP